MRMINARTALLIAASAALAAAPLSAQAGRARPGQNEFIITAEPLAAGARYLRGHPEGLRFGAGLTIGPIQGLTIQDADTGELDEWAGLHVLLGLRPVRGIRFLFGPGGALAVGDDFGALYPSGMAIMETAIGRFRLGTAVRAMRIAGSNGSGNYWIRWVPVRLGLALD